MRIEVVEVWGEHTAHFVPIIYPTARKEQKRRNEN